MNKQLYIDTIYLNIYKRKQKEFMVLILK